MFGSRRMTARNYSFSKQFTQTSSSVSSRWEEILTVHCVQIPLYSTRAAAEYEIFSTTQSSASFLCDVLRKQKQQQLKPFGEERTVEEWVSFPQTDGELCENWVNS